MASGFFSRLSPGKRKAEAAAERERLLELAYEMHLKLAADEAVATALAEAGAAPADIEGLNREARAIADIEILATVHLPESAQLDLNYYFLLGVTPRAGAERIRRAYRRKAREVHPDTHAQDFTAGQWTRFMSVLTDANDVLGDPMKRRAYDIFWRNRSRAIAAQYRRPGQLRGDWETRYLWEIAEMAEREDAIAALVDQMKPIQPGSPEWLPALNLLRKLVEGYEGAMLEIRTASRALPEHLHHFSERARAEMQRKERLVTVLRDLLQAARQATAAAGPVEGPAESALVVLREIARAQHSFDLLHARNHL